MAAALCLTPTLSLPTWWWGPAGQGSAAAKAIEAGVIMSMNGVMMDVLSG